jgi:DNA-binding PadR family transcriptional regulator
MPYGCAAAAIRSTAAARGVSRRSASAVRARLPRPARQGAARRHPHGDPAAAGGGAAQRLRDHAGARGALGRRLAPEPRVRLPRAGAARGRGADPLEEREGRKQFEITDAGRETLAARPADAPAPWDTLAEAPRARSGALRPDAPGGRGERAARADRDRDADCGGQAGAERERGARFTRSSPTVTRARTRERARGGGGRAGAAPARRRRSRCAG